MLLEDEKSYIEMLYGTVRFHFEIEGRGLLLDGAWQWPGPDWRRVALGAAFRHMDVMNHGLFVDNRQYVEEIGEASLGNVLVWLEKNGIYLEKCDSNHDVSCCDVELA